MKKNDDAGNKFTLFVGSYHAVVGTALSPDDPEFKRREQRGPNAPRPRISKKRGAKKKR